MEKTNNTAKPSKKKQILPCPYAKKLYPNKQKRALAAVAVLEQCYPDPACALQYEGDPFRLLVMAVLSAQCTDKRVNLVSPALFAAFPDAKSMAAADASQIEPFIKSCGLYKTKAKNLHAAAVILDKEYQGKVPADRDALLSLPGIGRKVANLLLGDLFSIPGIVADTHCIRISNRLGLCSSTDPYRVERDLDVLIPPEKQSDFCHRLVQFGRDVCSAPTPRCETCPLKALYTENQSSDSTERG